MVKNKTLYQYHLELETLKPHVLYFLFRNRIDQFYKNNVIRLNSLLKKLDDIQEKYFVIENGKVKQEGEPLMPVMKEGMLFDEYNKEFTELMEKDIPILL